MSRKINIAALTTHLGTLYPPPFDAPCLSRERTRLGDAAGLTQFGVNLLRLPPGAWSSQRHWHSHEDEFIYVLFGEVTLTGDGGPELLRAGDCAGFKAGDTNGHCLQNHSEKDVLVLEVGTRFDGDIAYYSDIDMMASPGGTSVYKHRDGTPYPVSERRGKKA